MQNQVEVNHITRLVFDQPGVMFVRVLHRLKLIKQHHIFILDPLYGPLFRHPERQKSSEHPVVGPYLGYVLLYDEIPDLTGGAYDRG